MVGDAAEPAGAGEGAVRLGAAPAAIGFAERGVVEYGFTNRQPAGEVAVYLLPGAVVLDGPRPAGVPHVVVEVSDGKNRASQRVHQLGHTAHSDGSAALRVGADLGGVVVDEYRQAVEFGHQDIAGGHYGAAAVVQVSGEGMPQMQPAAAVQQGAVDSAAVRRVEVNDAVVELAKGGGPEQPFQHKAVADLHKCHGIGNAPLLLADQQESLGDGVAF